MRSRRGRSPRTDTEYTKHQKITHENKSLKQEIASLRKMLSRIDGGWCPGCFKNNDKNHEEIPAYSPPKIEKPNKICYSCGEAELKMIKYYKLDEIWYFRICPHCKKRTRGKKFTPDVKE